MNQAKVGYVVRKNFRVGVNYDFDLKKTCPVETDHDLSDLKIVHIRKTAVPKGKANANMSFFLNTEPTVLQEMMESIQCSGLRPAIIPEVDHLRSLKRSGGLDCLFRIADDHARARKIRKYYVDVLCLPIFGTHIIDKKGVEYIAVMHLFRTCGSDRIKLFNRNELETFHQGWITPLVAA